MSSLCQDLLAAGSRLDVALPEMPEADGEEVRRVFSGAVPVEGQRVMIENLTDVTFNEAGEFFTDGGISPDWFASQEAYQSRDVARFERKFGRAQQNARTLDGGDDAPLWITDRYSHVYYHWVTHALARLEAAVLAGLTGRLLLPHWIAQLGFARDSLTAYPQIEPVFAGTGNWHAREVRLVTRASIPPDIHPQLVRQVSQRVTSYFGRTHAATETGRRIYVTRRLARNRQVVNERDLQPILDHHGLEIVEMERLGFAEQVALMQQTVVLAGPHGAGLTNALFMRKGPTLLELRQLEGPPLSFMKLAGVMGQRYRYCVCENAEPGMHHHGADIYIDPGRLEEALRAVAQ